jgi:hypothetical protein
MLCHVPEENQAVAGRQRIRVFEIELVLSVRIFMIEGIQIPSQAVDAAGNLVEPGEVVEETSHIVAGLQQFIVRIWDSERAIAELLEKINFALDPKIEPVA